LKASRIDSFYKDVEDDKAELWMVSVLRGVVGNGGAMVFVGSQRRRKTRAMKRRMVAARGRRKRERARVFRELEMGI
jgi:hypothetical protein